MEMTPGVGSGLSPQVCPGGTVVGGEVDASHRVEVAAVVQVEVDRRCYLDEKLEQPGAGFDRVAGLLETLAVELGKELLGRQYATAAE